VAAHWRFAVAWRKRHPRLVASLDREVLRLNELPAKRPLAALTQES
jgi:hypothetical protein